MSRQAPHICVLPSGQRVPFSLKQRSDEPFYFATFRGPDNRRLERSTKETSQNRARDAAVELIKEEYQTPQEKVANVSWDDAIERLRVAMLGDNMRDSTYEDYLDTLTQLRQSYRLVVGQESAGPGDITPELAERLKAEYATGTFTRAKPREPKVWKGRGRKPKQRPEPTKHRRSTETVKGRIRKLHAIWKTWFIGHMKLVTVNPWHGVSLPKGDKKEPRVLTAEEIIAFFDWLDLRWGGWRLPILMLTVKAHVGCRIGELCSILSDGVHDGHVTFDKTKGRKSRVAFLPADVFAEVKAQAGTVFLWDGFPAQLKERGESLKKPMPNLLSDFSPNRLRWWLQDEIADYCEAHPEVKRFSAHSFRKHAMTEAWKVRIEPQRAAVAYGCNVRTMMAHYVALDQAKEAEAVMKEVQSQQQFGRGGQPQGTAGADVDLRGN